MSKEVGGGEEGGENKRKTKRGSQKFIFAIRNELFDPTNKKKKKKRRKKIQKVVITREQNKGERKVKRRRTEKKNKIKLRRMAFSRQKLIVESR